MLNIEDTNIGLLWPSSGFAMAIMIIYGYRIWPAVFIGAFFINLSFFDFEHYQKIISLSASLGTAAGNTLEALIGTFFIRKIIKSKFILASTINILKFIVITLFISTSIPSLIGTSILYFTTPAEQSSFNLLWSSWWIGDSVSILLFTPLILCFTNEKIKKYYSEISKSEILKFTIMYIILIIISVFILGYNKPIMNFPTYRLEYALIPIIVWFALVFSNKGITVAINTIAIIAIFFTANNMGNFAVEDKTNSLLLMQFFISGMAITGLTLAGTINEKKHTSRKLENSEKMFKLLFENSGTANAFFDINLNLVLANKFSLLNIDKKDGYPEKISLKNIFSKPYYLEIEEKMKEAINSKKITSYEAYYEIKEKQKYFNIKLVPILNKENNVEGVQFIANDISNQKKAEKELIAAKEKAEESNELKTAFLSNVTHDIRNPLNGIIGFANFLKKDEIDSKKRKKIAETIISSSYVLLNLVNDLLDLAKIESGQTVINNTNFVINNLLNEVLFLYSNQAKEKGLKLFIEKNENTDEKITTDRDKLYQIISNLLSNAIKFTTEGHIKISYCKIKNYTEFKVSDTGIGIKPGNRIKIFNRFEQEFITTSSDYGGTGLGLSICEGYVKKMGGKIKIDSIEKSGSVFTFTIPDIKETVD